MDNQPLRLHPNLLLSPVMVLAFLGLFVYVGGFDFWASLPLMAVIAAIYFSIIASDIFRVQKRIRQLDGRLTAIRWEPFGPGWFAFGRRSSTLYKVEYVDANQKAISQYIRVYFMFGMDFFD